MRLKFYFMTAGICLSLTACTSWETKSDAPATAINSATASKEDLLETFLLGCSTELYTYCQDVTPGDGRELACIYAHEDKLSGRCENALYDAAQQLEAAVAALAYLATECNADIEKYCAKIEPGEGQIMDCMEPYLKSVGKRCQKAMQEVGLEKLH